MGFTPVDADHVQDDEGNTYYTPFLNYNPDKLDVPTPDPGPSTPTASSPPPLEPGPAVGAAVSGGITSGLPPTPPNDVRNALLQNDPAAFSQAGGTPQGDTEMAKMLGGHATHQAETAVAKNEAAAVAAQGEIDKNRLQAKTILDTADEYDSHVRSIQTESKARWTSWKKRNEEAASALVDPRHAFTDGGTASKINWTLMFIGAGLQGGNAVDQALQAMNHMVDQDIAVQKTNIANKRQGLEDEKSALLEEDKMGKDSVADWYFAKNLRLQATGKMLDAQIAQMGMPAAQKANLLSARDIIEQEVIKGQQHMADHYQTQAAQKSAQAHDVYMERLKSKLRMNEDMSKASIKTDEKEQTLPTGTGLGLQMVDKASGKPVVGGKIKLVQGTTAKERGEAGNILSGANEYASKLRTIQTEMKTMDTADLVRGGTPKFKAMVKQVANDRAVAENGKRVTDEDVRRAYQEIFGADIGGKLFTAGPEAIKVVGPFKEGILASIDEELRNVSSKTMNKLIPYIDSDTAQNFEFQYNPQETGTPEVNKKADDINTAVLKAADGADVSDLMVPGARPPVTKDEEKEGELETYKAERKKTTQKGRRGLQGTLPEVASKDEEAITDATAAFTHAVPEDILRLAQTYLRKNISEEAKHEIRMEAKYAMVDATKRDKAALEKTISKYQNDLRWGARPTGDPEFRLKSGTPESPYDDEGNYTKKFQKYIDTGVLDEMRKRAGLQPAQR